MKMTAYENTKRMIEFKLPEYLPICANAFATDISGDVVFIFPKQEGSDYWTGAGGMDEWGCFWEKTEVQSMGYVREHPLKDWKDLQQLEKTFPDSLNKNRYIHLKSILNKARDKYLVFCNGCALFERMYLLRGFDAILEDFYSNRRETELLADKLLAFQLKSVDMLEDLFPGRIHGFRLTDDWGTQSGLIISPELWREIFKPRYKKLFDRVHQGNLHVWLHSCGRINEILGDLIEIGLDVINISSPNQVGIEEVGGKYAGKICFESHCDIQTTLPKNDIDAISEEANLILKHWATPYGGFILGDIDAKSIGAADNTKKEMINIFQGLDIWRKKWKK